MDVWGGVSRADSRPQSSALSWPPRRNRSSSWEPCCPATRFPLSPVGVTVRHPISGRLGRVRLALQRGDGGYLPSSRWCQVSARCRGRRSAPRSSARRIALCLPPPSPFATVVSATGSRFTSRVARDVGVTISSAMGPPSVTGQGSHEVRGMGGAIQQRDAADEGRLDTRGSIIVGKVIVNQGTVVRPSQLIASVGRTHLGWRVSGTRHVRFGAASLNGIILVVAMLLCASSAEAKGWRKNKSTFLARGRRCSSRPAGCDASGS
jgi:hypothetical protein